MKYYSGVDLGGTNTKIGLCNEEGKILHSSSIKTDSIHGVEDTLERIWLEIQKQLTEKKLKKEDLSGIGIGIPGPVKNQSIVGFFANFPWEKNMNLKEKMETLTGIRTLVDNDVNVIAQGEAIFGAAKGHNSSITVALGTGIGGGIFVDGRLISGMTGAGGEIGHMKLVPDGKLCGCGQKGCFEAYASATGMIREALSRLYVNKLNALYEKFQGNYETLEAKDIFEAAAAGDVFSQEIVDYEAEYLAMGIGNLLNIINPEVVVLGGGIALAKEQILEPMKQKIRKYALEITLENLEIKTGVLGNEAGILGAAALFMLS
ncbi:glucokinase [Fusobacterium necrophorum subsp. funduliforme]|uniref:Glucokinase n=1 Tax=Fusobacterium necrophorum subsp. funduliforme TaxID=143387 RepID=A0A162IS57_9FUSO|nr:ROK family protein [Fusobacterium necrophorum]AYV92412.1 ROK family protein [Fusobacterium necrophorum subsp. funduliforme]KYL04358.1 glucokinase [Fusobacterium necrophorum subsp. funduliforme]KYM43381.1 glucokinase [Fusobacterium necrophorum subsp. funduliforme]KYM61762.1 glucokinase [Fusobacterium necrophorum subsp. funduliforme]KYM65357.1 glucokinase [Fusobacterium necrophorum subsp. funduliforme]